MIPERHRLGFVSAARLIRGAMLLLAGAFLSSLPAPAQFTPGMRISNFSASDPFPAPHYKQMRYVVTGAEGRPQADNKVLLAGVKLETFRVNGDREMIVEAPECIFDDKARTAGSAGKLILQSGDGKLRVEGDGFGCQLANKTLIISNNIRAVIQRPNTNAGAAPLVITSRWLEFDAEKRLAVFHDDVRGDDPEFAFTCGSLAVSATTNQSAFNLIEARDSLVVTGKSGGRRASADRGIYRNAEESIELIGNATWDVDGKSGRANRVTGLRKDESIQAEGKVAMKLPREAMGAATGLLSSSNTPAQNAGMVEVFADQFQWRSNVVTGSVITGNGAVRIVDAANRVSFSCDTLEARQAQTPSGDDTAVATGNVKVERDGANVQARRADYSRRAGAVVFTGNPHWQQAQIEGSAEQVTFKTAAKEMEIVADRSVAVRITLPTKGGGSPLAFLSQGATNQAASVVEVTSERLNVTERQALFLGKVNANQSPRTGSEMRLQSEMLEVRFIAQSNRLDAITATGNVVYEMGAKGITNGPAAYSKMTCRSLAAKADPATGEPTELVADGDVRITQPGSEALGNRVVYNRLTDVVKLFGDPPIIETPQLTYTGGREVEWDNRNHKVIGTGYRIVPKQEFKPEFLKKAAESQKLPGQ